MAATERIATETTLLPMAHLTAVNHSVAELRNMVGRLAGAGVRNVLADPRRPAGQPDEATGSAIREGVTYAEELVELVRDAGDFSVGVAAFPYKHPRSPDIASDTAQLHRQVPRRRRLRDHADVLRRRRLPAAARPGGRPGCDTPIVAGVMPVTSIGTIARSETVVRRAIPAGAGRAVRTDRRRSGSRAAARHGANGREMCRRLLDEGVPGIHFITLNRSTATRELWRDLAPVRA